MLASLLTILSVWAASDGAASVSAILGISAALLVFRMFRESGAASAVVLRAVRGIAGHDRKRWLASSRGTEANFSRSVPLLQGDPV